MKSIKIVYELRRREGTKPAFAVNADGLGAYDYVPRDTKVLQEIFGGGSDRRYAGIEALIKHIQKTREASGRIESSTLVLTLKPGIL